MLEPALEHVRDDLHVAMRMPPETLAGRHAILVDHAQRAEPHVLRIVVIRERKRVPAVEPAMLCMPALSRFANRDHVVLWAPRGCPCSGPAPGHYLPCVPRSADPPRHACG